jgi:methionyl-tRNA synthetase
METNLSPAARALIAAALVLIPILLVILQRLEDIREILRRRKDEGKWASFKEFLNPAPAHTGQGASLMVHCPSCGAENPRGQAFCGVCGKRLDPNTKDEQCD